MVSLDIRWEIPPEKLIEAFNTKFPGVLNQVVLEVAAKTQENIMKTTPVKTGNMRRNWLIRKISDCVYEIYNEVKYALWIEEGTRAHEAGPFIGDRKDGTHGWIARKRVAGIKARKIMHAQIKPAQDMLMLRVKAKIQQLWDSYRGM
jgi:hypothetical protein